MNKKYLSFDLEIARDLSKISIEEFRPDPGESIEILQDDGETWRRTIYTDVNDFVFWHPVHMDWKRFRPLGITCAAAASSDGGLWNWWAHTRDGRFDDRMSPAGCQVIVEALARLVAQGYTILTWNGLSFDFCILAEESVMHTECQNLALNYVDMMFHFHCAQGYPLGLDAAAKGQGLPGKPEGMDGALAPVLWAEGKYHKVLDYVSWDVKNTLALAQAVDAAGELRWTSRSGRPQVWSRGDRWLTVAEALDIPEPDTSWMTNPLPRAQFYEWTTTIPEYPPLPHFDVTGITQWDPDEGNWPEET